MNLAEWRAHLLTRLQRQVAATGDPRLAELLTELRSYPGGEHPPPAAAGSAAPGRPPGLAGSPAPTDVVVPLRYRLGDRELSLFSMTAVVGTPMDVTIDELAIESFYPANEATAQALWALRGAGGNG